jgi:hypothetical protein
MEAQRFGICEIRVNGVIAKYRGGLKLIKGTEEKEAVMGMDKQIHGYKVTPKVQGVEFEHTDTGLIDIPAMEKATDMTLQMSFNGGEEVWVLQNATLTSQWQTETEENKVSLAFSGTLVRTT